MLDKPAMDRFEHECPCRATEQVGEPIPRVGTAAARGEGLVPLVEPADESHGEDRRAEDACPRRLRGLEPEMASGEQ